MTENQIQPQTFKKYHCAVCGNEQEIRTNHYGSCFEYCKTCSWKSIGFDLGNNTMVFNGHAYRRFICDETHSADTDTNKQSINLGEAKAQ